MNVARRSRGPGVEAPNRPSSAVFFRAREGTIVLATLTEKKTPITVAYGDGIGPEIMDATLRILDASGAQLEQEKIEIGESVYKRGLSSGIEPDAWESL